MKKLITILSVFGVFTVSKAQLTVGNTGMTIKSGTVFSTQGLVLTPAADLDLSNNSQTVSATPFSIGADQSVTKIVGFSSPFSFNGTLGLKYNLSELNGNDESKLNIVYNSQTSGSNWTVKTGSTTGNLGSYYVSSILTNEVIAQISAIPMSVSAPSAADQTFCDGALVSELVASGTNLKWYTQSSGGSELSGTTVLASGTYYVSQTVSNVESTRTSIIVTVNTTPTITSVTSNSRCEAGTITLGAIQSSGTINWYDASTGGNLVGSGSSYTTSSLTASANYYVEAVDGNCTSSSRTEVQAIVNSTSSSSETISHCGAYTWAVNGQNYTQSGTYTEVIANAAGCDSTITLNLTIKDATSSSETVSHCGPYTWAVNGQNYTQSGTYTEVLQNAVGCDSTITLNLTIKNPSTNSVTVTNCGAYTWTVNGQNYTQSGTYTTVLQNAVGCDSTITLNLTINELPTASVSTSSPTTVCQGTLVPLNATTGDGLTYVWRKNNTIINGATNATYSVINSGFYEVEVTNAAGCKTSSAKTKVTVNPIPAAGAISGGNYVCRGSSVKLTPTIAGGVWSVLKPNLASIDQNGNVTGLMKTAQFTTDVVAYTVTNVQGCSSTVKRGLGIDSLPVVPIIAGPDKFCSNGTVLYRCTNLGSVAWTAGPLLTASSFYKGVFTHRVAQNGAIPSDNFASSITATSFSINKVCTSTSTKDIQLRTIATKAFAITAPTNLTVNAPVSVSASSTNLTTLNTSNRFWISNFSLDLSVTSTTALTTTIQALRVPTETPKLYFSATETSTGCGVTAYRQFTVTAASSLVDANSTQTTIVNGVHLYPNPSNGRFTIENTDGATSVKLVDIAGRVIATQPIVSGIATVDFSGVATGKYMVNISGDNFNEVQPIVIE